MATISHHTKKASAKRRAATAKADKGEAVLVSGTSVAFARLCEDASAKALLASSSVDHPAHYNTGRLEVIDVIEDWRLGFHLGNAVKYIARADHKGNRLEDLKKARWYLDREIGRL